MEHITTKDAVGADTCGLVCVLACLVRAAPKSAQPEGGHGAQRHKGRGECRRCVANAVRDACIMSFEILVGKQTRTVCACVGWPR